ncbi:hypothetical protein [Pareuzebyella sediminis]|uniref:hypothetical protein n=1 Tax=Pareuzebyella sediminis TaxID=2607998 RepID=UPI0011ED549D|nr:hypothetical protein [Pareuzebyella sediminis]
MVYRFLSAKHWQLFLLMIGLPLISQLFAFAFTAFNFGKEGAQDIMITTLWFRFTALIIFLVSSFYFGWLWSIAMGLQKYVPEEVHRKVTKFKILFFIPLVYMLGMALFIGLGTTDFFANGNLSFSLVFGYGAILIFFLHVISSLCMFYVIYFSAKTYKTVQLGREVRFGEIIGEFFLLWFYFIGIWIVQPKLNQWIKHKTKASVKNIS